MPVRNLPVRPDLAQLRIQAKELLRALRNRDPEAIAEARAADENFDPSVPLKLANAQHLLAKIYGATNWARLVQCCDLIDAIWNDDLAAVREIISKSPHLLHEHAGIRNNNWGPPMSYAANLGRDEIINLLHGMGAKDHQHAIGRAVLQSKIKTARMLYELIGSPPVPEGALGGPAYTLSSQGTAVILEFGGKVIDANGNRLAPVDVVLETDSRKPAEKHAILEMYVKNGLVLPDTPTMALHRGRIDLLEEHLKRDPRMLERQFAFEEIYPPEMGCHDEILATHGTPLAGATLLHMCADYDEFEIAQWLLERGMNVDAPAAINAEGFGGHTPLFSAVVSQVNFWPNYQKRPDDARFVSLFLNHGANPNARASLRKQLHPGYGPDFPHEYHNITPLAWGERFHNPIFVTRPGLKLLESAGGKRE